ncbi:hypothetical protein QZJ86_12200 [Methylomonas montana]|uniref:hypothetical protein n=1 Tax=Methylomonas montana TaxID=3058963 RepID=UPI00265AA557|nr:hypothetical protein [Methylomonas montana]WKJ88784.1 hypothetical protein QZJ86_12200 [Methylomonas montana]
MKIHDVEIRAIVPVVDRGLVPQKGDMIKVADCKNHRDWLELENGEIIPLNWKYCFVKKVCKDGSFLACGRWFRALTAQAYVNANHFGTAVIYL